MSFSVAPPVAYQCAKRTKIRATLSSDGKREPTNCVPEQTQGSEAQAFEELARALDDPLVGLVKQAGDAFSNTCKANHNFPLTCDLTGVYNARASHTLPGTLTHNEAVRVPDDVEAQHEHVELLDGLARVVDCCVALQVRAAEELELALEICQPEREARKRLRWIDLPVWFSKAGVNYGKENQILTIP